jgi:hypothetical protein
VRLFRTEASSSTMYTTGAAAVMTAALLPPAG